MFRKKKDTTAAVERPKGTKRDKSSLSASAQQQDEEFLDEESSLLAPRSNTPAGTFGSSGPPPRRGSCLRRTICVSLSFLVVLILGSFVAVAWIFQHTLRDLQARIDADESSIGDMQQLLRQHEYVIERFNNSITNTDVLQRLHELETSLKHTEVSIRESLERVEKDVTNQLNSTLNNLQVTVSEAQEEISREVTHVKSEVDIYVRTTQDQFSTENNFMVYQLAGTFMILSCLISMWHMTAHLRKFHQPDIQRRILSILWMSPIYAVTSWYVESNSV
jgi:Organic solute transporter Ostalpha